jgi:hypothetical protein
MSSSPVVLEAYLPAYVWHSSSSDALTLTQRLRQLHLMEGNAGRHRQVLKSLRYEGMNERYNKISEPNREIFQWIFDTNESQHHRDFTE